MMKKYNDKSKGAAFRLAALVLVPVLLFASCGNGAGGEASRPAASPIAVYTDAPSLPPTDAPTDKPTDMPTPAPTEEPFEQRVIREALSSMTLEEKVGQLLMFGVAGKDAPSEASSALLSEFSVGNVILFGDNFDKDDGGGFPGAKRLTEFIGEHFPCPVPRIFAIDAEGGNVVRFKWEPAVPSANKLGKGSAQNARETFARVGEKLRSCGINLDLAPVCDMNEKPFSTFLGSRIISGDPEITALISAAMIDGLHSGGCLACAKHFPGHGATTEDTHQLTPVVYKTREELFAYDLTAFSSAVASGVDCVMAAHILYPELDPDNIASMSPVILTEILRGELGFEGVIISDDIRMKGITGVASPEEAALRFILAGGDLVLCGADVNAQRSIVSALISACEDGRISPERLDESCSRILAAKLRFGVWQP